MMFYQFHYNPATFQQIRHEQQIKNYHVPYEKKENSEEKTGNKKKN